MTVGELKKYKDGLYSSLCRDISEFEKNFLYISGGILAFSITFIKDIVTLKAAIWFPLLFLSWFLIITAIAIMMYSFLRSAKASDDLWKIVDDFQISYSLYGETVILTDEQIGNIKAKINAVFFPIKRSLRKQRWFAVFSFVIGLILFSLFVGRNLIREKEQNAKMNKENVKQTNKFQIIVSDSAIMIKSK